jgi:hypothetical protein
MSKSKWLFLLILSIIGIVFYEFIWHSVWAVICVIALVLVLGICDNE